ncbi:MAG: tripartite tricarboxylate transporter substrate-binding protein [Betaproteobacteria bacterium]
MIVPFPPGGTADLLARLLATPMGNALGQQVVVDNRGGAGGVISMDALAHAPADGYTFGIPIDLMFNPVSSVLPFLTSGKLRALGISDRKRSAVLPNVPTMEESGFANFDILESWGLVAPVGTPPGAARRLHAEAVKVLSQPPIVERYSAQGLTFAPSTPERLREIMVAEIKKYRDIIQRAGIKAN